MAENDGNSYPSNKKKRGLLRGGAPMKRVYAGPQQMPGYTPQPTGFVYAGPVPSSGGSVGFMLFGQMQGQPDAQAAAKEPGERLGVCERCGCELFARSAFCPDCGAPLTWE